MPTKYQELECILTAQCSSLQNRINKMIMHTVSVQNIPLPLFTLSMVFFPRLCFSFVLICSFSFVSFFWHEVPDEWRYSSLLWVDFRILLFRYFIISSHIVWALFHLQFRFIILHCSKLLLDQSVIKSFLISFFISGNSFISKLYFHSEHLIEIIH